jgi:hypothetical protein
MAVCLAWESLWPPGFVGYGAVIRAVFNGRFGPSASTLGFEARATVYEAESFRVKNSHRSRGLGASGSIR